LFTDGPFRIRTKGCRGRGGLSAIRQAVKGAGGNGLCVRPWLFPEQTTPRWHPGGKPAPPGYVLKAAAGRTQRKNKARDAPEGRHPAPGAWRRHPRENDSGFCRDRACVQREVGDDFPVAGLLNAAARQNPSDYFRRAGQDRPALLERLTNTFKNHSRHAVAGHLSFGCRP